MARFSHTSFQNYLLSELPKSRDIFMMDEIYMEEWEVENLKRFDQYEDADPYRVGYITPVHISGTTDAGADMSWYPNTFDRFHEVKTFLPQSAFVASALAYEYDKRPQLFVKSEWLRKLHLRSNSIFVMIDAVDMSVSIKKGLVSHDKVIALRDNLDRLAALHPQVSFISFADSLLLKTNWTAGMVDSGVNYDYAPESLLSLFQEIQKIYKEALNLEIYGVFAQGSNEYYDDPLLHISKSQNHISLNSLGLPFAQISLIEASARKAIRENQHPPMEIYMDRDLFFSLSFQGYHSREKFGSAAYKQKLTTEPGVYYFGMCKDIVSLLKQT